MKMKTLPLLALFILLECATCTPETALSMGEMTSLWDSQLKLKADISQILNHLKEFVTLLSSHQSSWNVLEASGGDVTHPITVYKLLRHSSVHLKNLQTFLLSTPLIQVFENLKSSTQEIILPTDENFHEAALGIIRILHVYQLRLNNLPIEGGAPKTLNILDGKERTELAWTAVNTGYTNVGIEILQSTLEGLSDADCRKSPELKQEIVSKLNTAVSVHDHILQVQGPRSLNHVTAQIPYQITSANADKEMIHFNYSHGLNKAMRRYKTEDLDGIIKNSAVLGADFLSLHDNKTWMGRQKVMVEATQTEALCRGTNLMSENDQIKLFCSYISTSRSPWLSLIRFKLEIISLDPYITQVYDVISNRGAENIVKSTKESYKKLSKTVIKNGDLPTNKNEWLGDEDNKELKKLTKHLEYITSSRIEDSSEPYMITNHGIGREYPAYRDTLTFNGRLFNKENIRKLNNNLGERFATTVTFLKSPRSGGRTVFPWIGVGADPIQGSVLIWWNLLSTQEHDFLTWHASCPSISGSKWSATKWISYKPQWDIIQCSPRSGTKVALPVSSKSTR